MRIWHHKLLPHLCNKHLRATWAEAWAVWSILTNDKKGFRNHPQVKGYDGNPVFLRTMMYLIREEMLQRGFAPKPLPKRFPKLDIFKSKYQWQSLPAQTKILKEKAKRMRCGCFEEVKE